MSIPAVPLAQPAKLSNEELQKAATYVAKYKKITTYFPEKGKFRRDLYEKHLIHFEAGAIFKQRMFMAANRVGKTEAGCCELTYHLTGEYPKWWKGFRFTKANDWWVCGKDTTTVREIFQIKLLGKLGDIGSGFIPKHLINKESMTTAKKGETLITTFQVRHVPTGEWSTVTIKTYESGRASFEGTAKNIWLDEEPPADIYTECLTRTMSTGEDLRILLMTFTPMQGPTKTVLDFIGEDLNWEEGDKGNGKWLTNASWDDIPHLSEEEKAQLRASYPESERDARTKGIPVLGSGIVYRYSEEQVFVDPFEIPDHWRRVMALDFGHSPDPTAMLWGAIDPNTNTLYIEHEYSVRGQPPSTHAAVIQQMWRIAGFPLPGVCDPSGGGKGPKDGKTARMLYSQEHGINFISAENSLHPGIMAVREEFNANRIKVFRTCTEFKKEFSAYHYNEKGNLKGADHLMDCLRYMVLTGRKVAKSLAQYSAENTYDTRRTYDSPLDGVKDAWLYR